jgi:HPt (histidine-containing phosphotransfer) domain-containing protein
VEIVPATPEPVINEAILSSCARFLGSEAGQLIELFLQDTPQLVGALEAAAITPDFNELREAAHSLKSSSANLGAMALSAAAKRVELGARLLTLDRPAVAVTLVATEFARVRQAFVARSEGAAMDTQRQSDSLSA